MARGNAAPPVQTERVPDWVKGLTRTDLVELFGMTALRRAQPHLDRGAVTITGVNGQLIMATVSGVKLYTVLVRPTEPGESLFELPGDIDVASRCTCPMGGDCEHVVAVLQHAHGRLTKPAEAPQWEGILQRVVRDDEKPVDDRSRPLALLIEVVVPVNRYGGAQPAYLSLRPLMRGASGAWIRTGISWSDIQYRRGWPAVIPAHQSALATILLTSQTTDRGYYQAAEISAESLGHRLWHLLDEARQAGVTLVSGHRGDHPVHLCEHPAQMTMDASRHVPGGDIVVTPALTIPGLDATPTAVGSPAHGVFVQTPDALVLAPLAKPLTEALTGLLHGAEPLTIPAADELRFLTQYYPALRQRAAVVSSDGSVEFPEIMPPRLALDATFAEDHQTDLLWSFRYTVGAQAIDVPLLRGDGQEPVIRDAAAEEALLASLEFLRTVPGLTQTLPDRIRPGIVLDPTLSGWATVEFVEEVLPQLQARDDVDLAITGAPLEYEEFDGPPVVSVGTRDIDEDGFHEDWFDLQILVSVAEQDVPLTSLLPALAHGEQRLILPDGTWFSLDRPELHSLRRIVEEARALQDHESDGLRINLYQAGLWEELVALGVVAEQSKRWERTVGALLALDEIPHPEPPEKLDATLRPYQLDGYQWLSLLWDHGLGGILADDMGLGKTLQTLAMAERARENGTLTPQAPILVVAPTSVVATWQREAATFTPQLSVTAITRTQKKAGITLREAIAGSHIVVTSYALFRIDEEVYTGMQWSGLMLDEAQFVKNHQARTYQVARKLQAPVKIAITGTPLENSLMDLWSLLSIVAPGLFPTPEKFGELFRKPIESGASPDLLSTLRRRIRPLMLRRTKDAVAQDLPPKIEQVVAVPLNPAHRRIYDTHLQRERQRILGLLDDVNRNRVAILSALTQLRQLSLDVHLVVPDAPASVHSSKVDALIEQLVEVVAEGHRCLVFSQFTRFLSIVRKRLDAEGIDHVYLDGRTRNRPKRIAEFTDGEAPVFLISLKAGGSGLTLTQADYVFVLDPWWNPAVEAQAIDRTHRIGQDKTVMVYRLVSEGTIEEKVVALQERKRELFSRVVDEGGLMSAPLSADDIRGLLQG